MSPHPAGPLSDPCLIHGPNKISCEVPELSEKLKETGLKLKWEAKKILILVFTTKTSLNKEEEELHVHSFLYQELIQLFVCSGFFVLQFLSVLVSKSFFINE